MSTAVSYIYIISDRTTHMSCKSDIIRMCMVTYCNETERRSSLRVYVQNKSGREMRWEEGQHARTYALLLL